MKDNNHIDQFFKNHLADGKADAPDESWNTLKGKLGSQSTENSNKKLAIISLLILLLFSGITYFGYELHEQNRLLATLINKKELSTDRKYISKQITSTKENNATVNNYSKISEFDEKSLARNSKSINSDLEGNNIITQSKSGKETNDNNSNIARPDGNRYNLVKKNANKDLKSKTQYKDLKTNTANNGMKSRAQNNILKAKTDYKEVKTKTENNDLELKTEYNYVNSKTSQKVLNSKKYSIPSTKYFISTKINKDSAHRSTSTQEQKKLGIASSKMEKQSSKANSNIDKNQYIGIENNMLTDSQSNIIKTVDSEKRVLNPVAIVSSEEKSINYLDTLSLVPLALKPDSFPLSKKVNDVAQVQKAKKHDHKKGNKQLGYSLELMLAPEMSYRSVSYSQAPLSETIQQYKGNDRQKLAYSGGLLFTIDVTDQFYIRTGLVYSNFGDKNNSTFELKKTDTSYTKKNGALSTSGIATDSLYKFNTNSFTKLYESQSIPSGNTTLTSQTWAANENQNFTYRLDIKESTRNLGTYVKNSIHYIGVPVVIGTHIGNSRWKFGIFSGIITNLLVSPSSVTAYSYAQYNANEQQIISRKIDLNHLNFIYWGGIELNYQLNSSWSITLAPTIKRFMNTIYKDENIVKQLPYSYGIQFGLKYRIRNLTTN